MCLPDNPRFTHRIHTTAEMLQAEMNIMEQMIFIFNKLTEQVLHSTRINQTVIQIKTNKNTNKNKIWT